MTFLLALFARLGLAQRLKSALPYIGCGLAVAMLCCLLWARGTHYRNQRDHEHATVLEFKAASALAEAAALKAKADAEERYRTLAEKADANVSQSLADARAATARYALARRVRPDGQGPASYPTPAANNPNPGIPADSPGNAELAAITTDDLRICSDNSVKLNAAFEWAKSLAPAR